MGGGDELIDRGFGPWSGWRYWRRFDGLESPVIGGCGEGREELVIPGEALVDPGAEKIYFGFAEAFVAPGRHAFAGRLGGDELDEEGIGRVAGDGEGLAIGLAEDLVAQVEAKAGFGLAALVAFEAASLEEGIDVALEVDCSGWSLSQRGGREE